MPKSRVKRRKVNFLGGYTGLEDIENVYIQESFEESSYSEEFNEGNEIGLKPNFRSKR